MPWGVRHGEDDSFVLICCCTGFLEERIVIGFADRSGPSAATSIFENQSQSKLKETAVPKRFFPSLIVLRVSR